MLVGKGVGLNEVGAVRKMSIFNHKKGKNEQIRTFINRIISANFIITTFIGIRKSTIKRRYGVDFAQNL